MACYCSMHYDCAAGSAAGCLACRACMPPVAQPNPDAVNYLYGAPQPTLQSSMAELEREWHGLVWTVQCAIALPLLQALANWRGVVRSGPLVGVRK